MKRYLGIITGMLFVLNIFFSWAVAGEIQNGVTPGAKTDVTQNISTKDIIWTSGELADHIFGDQTLYYDTDPIVAPTSSQLEFKYGLWNSPDVTLSVSLNGTYLGSVVADQGYISPGPEYETWDVTGILQDGVNHIEVYASPSGGEAIVGAFTIYGEMTTGSINGTVTDVTGKPLRAIVIAINLETKEKAWAITDVNGHYEILDLEQGNYLVLCIKRGYKPGITTAFVMAGEATIVHFELSPKLE